MLFVKKFHTTDDLTKSRDFFLSEKKIGIAPSAFAAFSGTSSNWLPFTGSNYGSKFHEQFALFLFGNKMWIESSQYREGIIRRGEPFPDRIFILFVNAYRSFQSLFDVFDNVGLAVARLNGCRKGRLSMRKRFAFPAIKASVSFHKACKPLIEFFIRNDGDRYIQFFSRATSRDFTSSNTRHEVFSSLSSISSSEMKILAKQKKLWSFYYRKFFNLCNKTLLVFDKGIPNENIFAIFSGMSINRASKIILKKIYGVFTAHADSDSGIASWCQRNTTFGIKETSEKSHHGFKSLFKFHFNRKQHSPATTKCDGVRINSLLCHSLNTIRKIVRIGRRASPALKRVSRLYVESNSKPSNASALPNEYGNVFNIRILTSSEAPVARATSALGNDVYYNTTLGKQAITHVSQNEYTMRLLYRPPEFSGMLMQNATLAIKFAQARSFGLDKPLVIDLEFLEAA